MNFRKLRLSTFLVALVALTFVADLGQAFMGYSSTEATLSFDDEFEIRTPLNATPKRVKGWIEAQLLYLYGPMSMADVLAAPKGDHRVSKIKVTPMDGGHRTAYHFRGTIVLANGPRSYYEVILPINAKLAYEAGLRGSGDSQTNVCSDPHYPAFYDFSYFWSPNREGCPLVEGVHYKKIVGSITRIPNTRSTRPEYERLVDKNGRIHISVLIGLDDGDILDDPKTSGDIAADIYRGMRTGLKKDGFEQGEEWKIEQLAEVVPRRALNRLRQLPSVDEWTKTHERADGRKIEIVVRFFLGPSAINERSTPFHYFLKDAMANSAVLLYDGHSGDGENLRLAKIERKHRFKLTTPANRYQIYFFNSCSSYAYYNKQFFGLKSSKNLDIVTAGLATDFDSSAESDLSLIRAIDLWAERGSMTGYRSLIRKASLQNLLGVNGDEDNPTFPSPQR